jgi:hypothetical protein
MTAKAFLIIVAILSAIFGLGMLLIPGECLATLGVTIDVSGDVAGRIAGTALIGLAVGFWYARDADMSGMLSPAAKGILYGGCIFNILGVIIAVWATIAGKTGPMGWLLAVIHLVLAVGFIYFAELKRSMARA